MLSILRNSPNRTHVLLTPGSESLQVLEHNAQEFSPAFLEAAEFSGYVKEVFNELAQQQNASLELTKHCHIFPEYLNLKK